jgi:hypothetical protein
MAAMDARGRDSSGLQPGFGRPGLIHGDLPKEDRVVRTRTVGVVLAWLAGLAVPGCTKAGDTGVSAAEKDRAAAEQAAKDKSALEKAAGDKAVAEKVASDKAAADRAVAKQQAERAALPPDLVAMKAEVGRALSQLDFTMSSLDVLSASTGALDKPRENALSAIKTLAAETQAVKTRADEMRDRGAAYFETWDKQLAAMSTPAVVALAQKRKDELAAKYAEVLTGMQECRAALDPFQSDLTAIQKVIEGKLDEATLKGLAPQITEVKAKAATLKNRVETVTAKLDQVGVIYTRP